MDQGTVALPKRLLGIGFTLVELLVVLVIIGLSSSAALPILQSRIDVARRDSAILDLERVCRAQEDFFINYDRYATNFKKLG
jgi:prepilin-type N-terminal cleavage/methylation domain-containing protein